MKILFTRFPLESTYGGAEVQVLSLMEGLMKRGHAVTFLGSCPTLLKECKNRNIPSTELNIGPPPVTKWNAISFFWRKNKMNRLLKEAIKQFSDLDAIIMLSLTEKLLLTNALRPTPYAHIFWLEHDRVGRWLEKNPWLPKLRELSNKATTIVVSELSKKIYIKLGWPEEKVIAIPNGIDPNRFITNPTPHAQRPTPNAPHPTPHAPRPTPHIGCISRLTHDKGVDLLIKAIKELSNTRLTIVGTGREENILKRATRNAQRINIIKRVDNLSTFYNSINVLVLPSREHDPFGLVAAEAMMLGIPVVVTDACGIADYLENGKDAVIVKANSAQALKEGIEICLASNSIASEGQKTAMEKFTVDKMIDEYEKLLS